MDMQTYLVEKQETVGTTLVLIICILLIDLYIRGFVYSACLQ